jgi:putative transposase
LAPNTLERCFAAERPNQRWAAEGRLFLAVVLDLFSRRIAGWSMKSQMTAELVTDALMMAL